MPVDQAHPFLTLPLRGADYLMLAFDGILRNHTGRGNVCALAFEFSDAQQAESLIEPLLRSSQFLALNTLRLKRRGFTYCWRTSHRGVRSPIVCSLECSQLPQFIAHHDIDPFTDAPLQVVLVHFSTGHSALVFFWHHALTDARGGELLISSMLAGEDIEFELPKRRRRTALADANKLRREIFRASAAPLRGVTPGRLGSERDLRYMNVTFTAEETRQVDATARSLGLEMFPAVLTLAASARALAAVCDIRRDAPGAFQVTVPHSLRRAGARKPLSNDSSYLFFRILPETLGDLKTAATSLLDQSTAMIREGLHLACPTLLDAARFIPLTLYRRFLGQPSGGRFASFYFSDVGEMFSLRPLDGALSATVSATHYAPHYAPPGLSVVFSRFRGALRLHIPFCPGAIAAAEIDDFVRLVRADLLSESRVKEDVRLAV
ncbi:MAG: hypothetical protein IT290_08235 [Deltaproteobacteria bacterium]|nr:hypothetical protein [Deltaproteobacteria bacterium]